MLKAGIDRHGGEGGSAAQRRDEAAATKGIGRSIGPAVVVGRLIQYTLDQFMGRSQKEAH